MSGSPSIVFTRKAVEVQTFIQNSENICKSIVGIDASQFYPFSMYQEKPTGLYTRWKFDSDSQKLGIINEGNLSTWLYRTYNRSVLIALLKVATQLEQLKKKVDCFNVDGFFARCKNIWSNGLILSFLCMSGSKSRHFRGRDPEKTHKTGLSRRKGKKDTKLLRYGNVTGWTTSKMMNPCKNIFDESVKNNFPSSYFCYKNLYLLR